MPEDKHSPESEDMDRERKRVATRAELLRCLGVGRWSGQGQGEARGSGRCAGEGMAVADADWDSGAMATQQCGDRALPADRLARGWAECAGEDKGVLATRR